MTVVSLFLWSVAGIVFYTLWERNSWKTPIKSTLPTSRFPDYTESTNSIPFNQTQLPFRTSINGRYYFG